MNILNKILCIFLCFIILFISGCQDPYGLKMEMLQKRTNELISIDDSSDKGIIDDGSEPYIINNDSSIDDIQLDSYRTGGFKLYSDYTEYFNADNKDDVQFVTHYIDVDLMGYNDDREVIEELYYYVVNMYRNIPCFICCAENIGYFMFVQLSYIDKNINLIYTFDPDRNKYHLFLDSYTFKYSELPKCEDVYYPIENPFSVFKDILALDTLLKTDISSIKEMHFLS